MPPANRKRLSGKELVDAVGRKFLFSAIGWCLGLLALWQFQRVLQGDDVQAISKACEGALASPTNRADFLKTYHDFEPWLGGGFVCFGTQFLHRLVQDWPAGMIVWAATWSAWLPALVLVIVEAGRSGAVGPLRFPTVLLLLAQFGVSIVFPAIWVPSFVWGRSTHTFKGTVSVRRGTWSWCCILPGVLLTSLVFLLDPKSYWWTLASGLLVSPASALISLPFWAMDPPQEDQANSQMVHSVVRSYWIAGIAAFLMWAAVLVNAAIHYGLDFGLLKKDCWTEAHGLVRLMAVDAAILYAGLLAYIGYIRTSAVVETIIQTVFFGPGAAVAATLAVFELERSPCPTSREGGEQKKND